jgi:hypothetical protein
MVVVVAGLSVLGCSSPEGNPDYTATGALVGGVAGARLSAMDRSPLPGAMVGALVGGIIGHGMDQAEQERLRAQSPQTYQRIQQSQPLSLADVKSLVAAGIKDDLIISQIRSSHTVFHLASADIIGLKRAGVSDRVVDFMINTPTEVAPAFAGPVAGPPPPPVEVVPLAPGPDFVWVGGAWVWQGNRWAWRRGYWGRPPRHAEYGRIYPRY